VLAKGYLPSLCTSCYRRHRTGNTFTEMAVEGHIRDFCLPNALLTLAEFAVATEDAVLREECLNAVREARAEMEGSPLLPEYDRKFALVFEGGRDLFF
jgi:2-iminoacetate synthase